jgi:hypothetical protein
VSGCLSSKKVMIEDSRCLWGQEKRLGMEGGKITTAQFLRLKSLSAG